MSTLSNLTYTIFNDETTGTSNLIEFKLPESIILIMQKHARQMASIKCSKESLERRNLELKTHLTAGTIPSNMEHKFKKLFTLEHETNLRSTAILNSINHQIAMNDTKTLELNTTFNSRIENITQTLRPTLDKCHMLIDMENFKIAYNHAITTTLLEFELKRIKDTEFKEKKKVKFLEFKERQQLEVKLNQREVTKANKTISTLVKQVKHLTLISKQQKQGNGKGLTKLDPSVNPKKNIKLKKGSANKLTSKSVKLNGNKKSTASDRQ